MATPRKSTTAGRTRGPLYPRRSTSGPTVTLPPGFAGPSTTPVQRRPDFGVNDGTVAPTNPAAIAQQAAAAAGPTLPVSAGQQAAIDALVARLGLLPGIYNTRRKDAAANTVASLADYSDTAHMEEQAPDAEGKITYRIVTGADGKLYRQAFAQTRDSFNSRGLLGSSFDMKARRDAKQALDTRMTDILRGYDQTVGGLRDQQTQETTQTSWDLSKARGDYADWQAQQPASVAASMAPPPAVQTAAPITPGGPQPVRAAPKPIGQALGAGLPKALAPSLKKKTPATGVTPKRLRSVF